MKMETIEELKQRGDAKCEQAERKEMDLHLAHHQAALAAFDPKRHGGEVMAFAPRGREVL